MYVHKSKPLGRAVNFRVMIGDRILTPQEAFKIYISFLKAYGFYPFFLKAMRKYYGVNYQMYKTHFLMWSTEIAEHGEKQRHYKYFWYNDLYLLLPFVYKKDYDSDVDGETVIELYQFFCEYIRTEKLFYSQIKTGCIDDLLAYTTPIGNTLQKVLGEVDYPTTISQFGEDFYTWDVEILH